MRPIVNVDGVEIAISPQELIQLLDRFAFYSGHRVQTSPTGSVTATTLNAAIAQLEAGKQGAIDFRANGVSQGTAAAIDFGAGLDLDLSGGVATLVSGASISAQSFGANLILPASTDQTKLLSATAPSLTVSLSQPTSDYLVTIYNAGAESFTVLANWEGNASYSTSELLITGEASLVDLSPTPKTLTPVGETALSGAFAKFGSQSIQFDGAGDYLSAGSIGTWNFLHDGTTSWTLSGWIRLTNTTGTLFSTATAETQRGINITAAGNLTIYNGTSGQTRATGTFTPPTLNAFVHLAIVYDSTVPQIRVYLDGSLVSTITTTNPAGTGNSNTALIIGNQITGYLDDLYLTKAALYSGNFTPPTIATPAIQRIGTQFTRAMVPSAYGVFAFDSALGWQSIFTLPAFEFRGQGVLAATVAETRAIDYTGPLATTFTGGTLTVNSTAIPASEKGANNGVATLDSNGLIPTSQLPVSAMEFKGTWDATTNTPTLADGTGNTGDTYRVSVAGTQNLGSGSTTYAIGDWVLYNGSIWQRVVNSEAVASVFGRIGVVTAQSGDYSAAQVTNTPAGSIAATTVQAALNELDTEKQPDLQWQDDGVNQGTPGQATTVNITGAGVTTSVSGATATINIPGTGTSPTLTLLEQGSAPTPGVNEATLYIDTSQVLRYREESSGTIQQIAILGRSQTYTGAQGTAEVALTDAATIAVDASLSNAFRVTLAGNRTLANPTNTVNGFTYVFRITQDATGTRTLVYGTNYKFPGGTAPTLSTTANAVDILTCYCSNGLLNCNLVKDFR